MVKINAADYGLLPGNSPLLTRRLRSLLDRYRRAGEAVLCFPGGIYHFYPDYGEEILLCIPNHDEDGLKRVAFNLSGYEKLTIRGEDAQFVFHTDILPFLLRDCREICIQGITVDYDRPGYSQGVIQKAGPRRMAVRVDRREFPWYVRGNRVYFYGENYCRELERWMELDACRQEPVSGLTDRTFNLESAGESAVFRDLGEDILEVELGEGEKPFEPASREGNYLILRHHLRNHPAFYAENSEDIRLRDVRIWHALGMGVTACRCRNISLERVEICRHTQKHHVFTTEADGFHFVLCGGSVSIRNCLCENQLDDGVNIHGIYGRVKEILEDGSFLTELVHHQQKGVELIRSGERFRILDPETMLFVGENRASKVKIWNRDFLQIRTEEPLPYLRPGQALENLEWLPTTEITGCSFRGNRARGVLCTGGGRTVIRENYFRVPGAAVLIEGDSRSWYESGAVTHVLVENNIFDCCAYVPAWGRAPVQVTPSAPKYVDKKAYHGTLEIRDNVFRVCGGRLVWAENLETLIWSGNRVEQGSGFAPIPGPAFELHHVLHKEGIRLPGALGEAPEETPEEISEETWENKKLLPDRE